MFIGDGGKLVRDAFDLAKKKGPSIIFIGQCFIAALVLPSCSLSRRRLTQMSWTRLAPSASTATSRAIAKCAALRRLRRRPHAPSLPAPGATHDARAAESARRLLAQRQSQSHRRHQPRRHSRPGAVRFSSSTSFAIRLLTSCSQAALWSNRSKNRIPAAQRGAARRVPIVARALTWRAVLQASRARIMQIHAQKFTRLSRATSLLALCVWWFL